MKNNLKSTKEYYFLVVIVAIFVCLIIQVLCMSFSDILENNVTLINSDNIAVIRFVLYHIMSILIFGGWYYKISVRKRPTKIHNSFLSNINLKIVLAIIILGVALCFLANGILMIETVMLPSGIDKYNQTIGSIGVETNIIVTITTIIIAPIGEELLCRGVVFFYAKKAFSQFFLANCLQAFMFGFIHGNLIQGIYAFVIGIVMGVVVEKYQSILPSIALHIIVNFSSITWVDFIVKKLTSNLIVGISLLVVSSVIVIFELSILKIFKRIKAD